MQPIENTLIARLAPKRFHHSAFGAKFVLTFGVGALAVKMVSAIESNYDIKTIFYLLALLAAAAVIFIGWLIVRSRQLIDTRVMDAVDIQLPSAKL
jgi:predicted permease